MVRRDAPATRRREFSARFARQVPRRRTLKGEPRDPRPRERDGVDNLGIVIPRRARTERLIARVLRFMRYNFVTHSRRCAPRGKRMSYAMRIHLTAPLVSLRTSGQRRGRKTMREKGATFIFGRISYGIRRAARSVQTSNWARSRARPCELFSLSLGKK